MQNNLILVFDFIPTVGNAALCHADGSWSNGEGLIFGGGVFSAVQNNLIWVFNFIPTVGKNNLASRFA